MICYDNGVKEEKSGGNGGNGGEGLKSPKEVLKRINRSIVEPFQTFPHFRRNW